MKYKVLLFEDKHSSLEELIKELEKSGYNVIEYQDPVENMEVKNFKLNSSDYIIMDITRPFINGINLFEKIKNSNVKIKNIAVFAGLISDADIDKAVAMGCRIFPKPPNIVSLLDWLETRKSLNPTNEESEEC